MSERFQVASYGSHSFEIQDTVAKRHVCVVGMPEQSSARNRHQGEAVPAPRDETLELARAVADALNAAAGADAWKVSETAW